MSRNFVSKKIVSVLIVGLALALATACSRTPEQRVRASAEHLLMADRAQSALETVESYLRDIPVLLLGQVRLILRIAALYGEEITTATAPSSLARASTRLENSLPVAAEPSSTLAT